MLVVKVKGVGATEQIVRITHFPAYLGRSAHNEIFIDHGTVSNIHAMIDKREDGYFLIDCESTNGITFEGARHKKIEVRGRTEVKIGSVRVELVVDLENREPTQEIVLSAPAPVVRPSNIRARKEFLRPVAEPATPAKTLTAMFTWMAAYLVLYGIDYFVSVGEHSVPTVVSTIVGLVISTHAVTLFLSVYSKIHCGAYQYVPILNLVSVTVVVFYLLGIVGPIFSFNIDSKAFKQAGQLFVSFSLVFTLAYFLVARIFLETPVGRLKLYLSCFLVPFFFLIHLLEELNDKTRYHFDQALGIPLISAGSSSDLEEILGKKMARSLATIGEDRKERLEKLKKKEQEE